jgi:hypothetical protein
MCFSVSGFCNPGLSGLAEAGSLSHQTKHFSFIVQLLGQEYLQVLGELHVNISAYCTWTREYQSDALCTNLGSVHDGETWTFLGTNCL